MDIFLDHMAMNVKDPVKMVDFYTGILDLEPERVNLFREGKVIFPSVRINENTIIDFFPESLWNPHGDKALVTHGITSMNHFCITVPQKKWQELKERVLSRNIEIVEGPAKRWGSHGTGVSIYFLDPENNKIEVRYYEEK